MRACVCCMRYGLRNCGDRETGQLASAPPPRAGAARRRPRPTPQPRAREVSSAGRRGAAGKCRAKPSCAFSPLICTGNNPCVLPGLLVSAELAKFRVALQKLRGQSEARGHEIARTSHLPSPTRQTPIDRFRISSQRVCCPSLAAQLVHSRAKLGEFLMAGQSVTRRSRPLKPPRPQGGTAVIAPPLPTVLGHGISRCHPTRGD